MWILIVIPVWSCLYEGNDHENNKDNKIKLHNAPDLSRNPDNRNLIGILLIPGIL